MSNTGGFEDAKGRRNWLERLAAKIPGFSGFQDRELRREVDRHQREHLAGEVGRLKTLLRARIRAFTDAGKLGSLQALDGLDKGIDGLSQAVRFADYGLSGLFDAVKINEPELARLYEFDVALLGDLEILEEALEAIPAPSAPDPEARAAFDAARAALDGVMAKWAERETVISNVVATGR